VMPALRSKKVENRLVDSKARTSRLEKAVTCVKRTGGRNKNKAHPGQVHNITIGQAYKYLRVNCEWISFSV
jgi:hypothetical protein